MGQKRKVKISVRKGTLTRFGYHINNSERSRHIALNKAVRSEGYLPIFRKLNALAIFRKNKKGVEYRNLKNDMKYLNSKYKK